MVITRLRAEDHDAGENSRLTFQFNQDGKEVNQSGPKVEEYFSIDEQTGAVSISKQPGKYCESFNSMAVLNVSVSDNGEQPSSKEAVLFVMLYGCEDYLPEGKMLLRVDQKKN